MAVLDSGGVYGSLLQYGFTFALMGSAALVFVYLWRKGRLDLDESPKLQMFDPDHDGSKGEER